MARTSSVARGVAVRLTKPDATLESMSAGLARSTWVERVAAMDARNRIFGSTIGPATRMFPWSHQSRREMDGGSSLPFALRNGGGRGAGAPRTPGGAGARGGGGAG